MVELTKKFIFDYSKFKRDLDFSELKEDLIILKENYNIYRKYKPFATYLNDKKITVILYLKDDFTIKILTKNIFIPEQDIICINDYTINTSNELLEFVTGTRSLNSIFRFLKKQCEEEINQNLVRLAVNFLTKK